jgi:hypothetical protein
MHQAGETIAMGLGLAICAMRNTQNLDGVVFPPVSLIYYGQSPEI